MTSSARWIGLSMRPFYLLSVLIRDHNIVCIVQRGQECLASPLVFPSYQNFSECAGDARPYSVDRPHSIPRRIILGAGPGTPAPRRCPRRGARPVSGGHKAIAFSQCLAVLWREAVAFCKHEPFDPQLRSEHFCCQVPPAAHHSSNAELQPPRTAQGWFRYRINIIP